MRYILERELARQGYVAVAGVDEVGVGAWAGPVVAAAVILPISCRFSGLNDSKQMMAFARERVAKEIQRQARALAIGSASVEEINTLGIRPATFLACRRALEGVAEADYALIDAWHIPTLALPHRGIIRGDAKVASIAAASVVAKVHRDTLMCQLAEREPHYGFEEHKGYGTPRHQEALRAHGPCPLHRTSWDIFSRLTL